MAKAKQHTHGVVVGLNIVTDDGEVRYEPGEPIDVEHVEQWMIDEGHVEGPNVAEPAPDAAVNTAVARASTDEAQDQSATDTAQTAASASGPAAGSTEAADDDDPEVQ